CVVSSFDRISHDWLVAQVPMDRAILQKWLKSGDMDKHLFDETTEGTAQGGIVSPALANMALDGLERILKKKYPSRPLKSLGNKNPSVNFIRYADHFIVSGRSKDLLERDVKPLIEQFLLERG